VKRAARRRVNRHGTGRCAAHKTRRPDNETGKGCWENASGIKGKKKEKKLSDNGSRPKGTDFAAHGFTENKRLADITRTIEVGEISNVPCHQDAIVKNMCS